MYKKYLLLAACGLILTGCGGEGESESTFDSNTSTSTSGNGNGNGNGNGKYLVVPKDYDKPDGDKVRIYYTIHPATSSKQRIGILLLNFGGPGATAADRLLSKVSSMPTSITESFDIVAMDPRGAGKSAFARELMTCAVGGSCDSTYKEISPYMGSNAVIQDMDSLREHLNEDQINYLGYSYGTRLGALYAERYPTKIRALVLDSSMSPLQQNYEELRIDQAQGHQKIAEYRLDSKPKSMAKLDDIVTQTKDSDYTANDGGTIKKDDVNLILGAIKHPMREYLNNLRGISWSESKLGLSLSALFDKDEAKPFICWRTQCETESNSLSFSHIPKESFTSDEKRSSAMFRSVMCTDERATLDDSDIEGNEDKYLASSSIYGYYLKENLSGLCKGWTAQRSPIASQSEIKNNITEQVLIVGGLYDPQTSYNWSVEMKDTINNAALITIADTVSHGFSYNGIGSCLDDIVTNYLLEPEVKVTDRKCERVKRISYRYSNEAPTVPVNSAHSGDIHL